MVINILKLLSVQHSGPAEATLGIDFVNVCRSIK